MKTWEDSKEYKKIWGQIKKTDPWRYDLNEEFYENLHDRIMLAVENQPTPQKNSWWGSWRKSWRPSEK